MKFITHSCLTAIACLLLAGCGGDDPDAGKAGGDGTSNGTSEPPKVTLPKVEFEALPDGLEWVTNDTAPLIASPKAKRGGNFSTFLPNFPLTLRYVGPDSNGSFRSVINDNRLSLTIVHPNTREVLPSIASHWAYDADGKTVFYKVDKRAKWSDGVAVTAHDFTFALEFYRSKAITAPWYNNHYTDQIKKVRLFDDYTFAIEGKNPKPKKELHYYYGMTPIPRHFHKLDENWVQDYNWKIEPNTGPYYISKVDKGKRIVLKRKADWWGDDLRFYQNRYNVEKITYRIIRDPSIAYIHFEKGELDAFGLTLPEYWHNKAQGEIYDKGYVEKMWFYVDQPQPSYGIWLNQDVEIFKDQNVRYAFAHAMNIDGMIESVLHGDYQRLHNLTTGYGEYDNREIRARDFDLAKVDEYMQKAGWGKRGSDGIRVNKDGKRFSVRVTYGDKPHTPRLVFLKEEAKKAGIELVLDLLDRSNSFKKMLEKKHEVAWMAWAPMMWPQYWGQYHSENAHKDQTNNLSNTDNKELDELIIGYKNALDTPTKVANARKIQQMIHEEGASLPTYMVPYFRVAHWRYWTFPEIPATKLSDSAFDLYGSTGGLFWLDEAAKEETEAAMKSGKAFAPVLKNDTTYKVD
jgi:microcin C transport system substrate-binding protein